MAATQKSSKKRPAPTQSGPTPKKLHLAKSSKDKDIFVGKKRSRPITLPVQEENSEDEDEFGGLGGAEDDLAFGEEVIDDEMAMESSIALPKDPNGLSAVLLSLLHVYMGHILFDVFDSYLKLVVINESNISP